MCQVESSPAIGKMGAKNFSCESHLVAAAPYKVLKTDSEMVRYIAMAINDISGARLEEIVI